MSDLSSHLATILRKFTDKEYGELFRDYLQKSNATEIKDAIRNNGTLMKGINDIAVKVKLTGELEHGLGAILQTGIELGFYLAYDEIKKASIGNVQ